MVRPRSKYPVIRVIKGVESLGEKECKCILIDHPDNLYLTNNFIITHNTHLAVAFAIYEVLQNTKKKIVLTRPIIEAGESLGFLPGDVNEKVNPYMIPFFDVMEKLVGGDERQKQLIKEAIRVSPLAYMRGVTF